jgi:DNA repair protein RadC
MVLVRAMRGADTKPSTKNLIARFGSFTDVICAPPLRSIEAQGVGEVITTELKLILAAALRLLKAR